MKPDQIWRAALGEMQMSLSPHSYNTWVRDTHVVAYEDGNFIIGTPNTYARDWLENRLKSTAQRTVTGIMGRAVDISFVVWKEDPAPAQPHTPTPSPDVLAHTEAPAPAAYGHHDGLNMRYTFDSFVVGPSNRLAHAASVAVSENPARDYNPLFLYGGVGLGKTHLLQAIGNDCRARGLNVLYVTSEVFTNDLIEAIRNRTTDQFRDKYRTIDVLLIDDIQFIAGKESTQEEFFHTFNSLHSTGRQIVATSDRAPRALVTLEERLRSRFEWGLIVDVQPPEIETRIAILRAKADELARHIPTEVIEVIARRVQRNIRELEGALKKVVAYADFLGHPLTLQTAETAIADMLPNRQRVTVEQVIEVVCEYYEVAYNDMVGRSRQREIAHPRQVVMYLAREETEASLPEIGAALNRDHTTVMHGYDRIATALESDNELRREVMAIRERLHGDNSNSRVFEKER